MLLQRSFKLLNALSIGGLLCEVLEAQPRLEVGFLSEGHWKQWSPTGGEALRKGLVLEALNAEPGEGHGDESFVWSDGFSLLHCRIAPLQRSVASSLLRAFTVAAWQSQRFLIHASGLCSAGRAVVVVAPSGGGKSTLMDLAQGFCSLSDETLLLSTSAVVGTPFRSSASKPPEPRTAPVAAVLLLEKAASASYSRVDARTALTAILPEMYRPPEPLASSAEILHRAKLFAESVPAYRFRFPKSPAANDLLKRLFDEELSR